MVIMVIVGSDLRTPGQDQEGAAQADQTYSPQQPATTGHGWTHDAESKNALRFPQHDTFLLIHISLSPYSLGAKVRLRGWRSLWLRCAFAVFLVDIVCREMFRAPPALL
jgi:hypothetical protein